MSNFEQNKTTESEEAYLDTNNDESNAPLFEVGKIYIAPVGDVKQDPNNPRKSEDIESQEELTNSIRQNGILNPVRGKVVGGEIIATDGSRRIKGARAAGLDEIPVLIIEDDDTLKVAVMLNTLRDNLNPVDEGEAYEELIRNYGLAQNELAERIGRSPATISQALKLCCLTDTIKASVRSGTVILTKQQLIELANKSHTEQTEMFGVMTSEDDAETHQEPIIRRTLNGGSGQITLKKVNGRIKCVVETRRSNNSTDDREQLNVQIRALVTALEQLLVPVVQEASDDASESGTEE